MSPQNSYRRHHVIVAALFLLFILHTPFVFSIQTKSDSLGRKVPSGLATFLMKDGTFAHGFIIEDMLYSAAHALEDGYEKLFVTQDGTWFEITHLQSGPITLHPKYKSNHEVQSQINRSERSPQQVFVIEEMAKVPFDIAYQKLSQNIKSDFILSPALTIPDLTQQINDLDSPYKASIATAMIPEEVNFQSTERDVSSLKTAFDPIAQNVLFGFLEEHLNSSDILLELDMDTAPGMSGAPLFKDSVSQEKLVVMGILKGVAPGMAAALPTLLGIAEGKTPNLFTSVTELNKWLSADGSGGKGQGSVRCGRSLE